MPQCIRLDKYCCDRVRRHRNAMPGSNGIHTCRDLHLSFKLMFVRPYWWIASIRWVNGVWVRCVGGFFQTKSLHHRPPASYTSHPTTRCKHLADASRNRHLSECKSICQLRDVWLLLSMQQLQNRSSIFDSALWIALKYMAVRLEAIFLYCEINPFKNARGKIAIKLIQPGNSADFQKSDSLKWESIFFVTWTLKANKY